MQTSSSPLQHHETRGEQTRTEENIDGEPKSGVFGAAFNFINSIVGAGIIGLPFAVSVSGPIPGFLLLCGVTILVDYTVGILVRTAHKIRDDQLAIMERQLPINTHPNQIHRNQLQNHGIRRNGRRYDQVQTNSSRNNGSRDTHDNEEDALEGNEGSVILDYDSNEEDRSPNRTSNRINTRNDGVIEDDTRESSATAFSTTRALTQTTTLHNDYDNDIHEQTQSNSIRNDLALPTYQELGLICLGPVGFYAVSLFQFVFAYGAMCAYAVIVGDTFPVVFRTWVGDNPHDIALFIRNVFGSRHVVIALATILISFPLSLNRNIGALEQTSAVSIAAIIFIVISVIVEGTELPADSPCRGTHTTMFSITGLFRSIGVISFAFVCHHNTFLILGSLNKPTTKRFRIVTHISTGVSLLLCLLLAGAGYIIFGDKAQGNVLNNFPHDSTLINFCRLAFGLNMFLTFPLECLVCREVIAQMWYRPPFQINNTQTAPQLVTLNPRQQTQSTVDRNELSQVENDQQREQGQYGSNNEKQIFSPQGNIGRGGGNGSVEHGEDDVVDFDDIEIPDYDDLDFDTVPQRISSQDETRNIRVTPRVEITTHNGDTVVSPVILSPFYPPAQPSTDIETSEVFHFVVTTALVGSALLIAESTCDLGAILEASGGLSATALAFVLPPLFFLRSFGLPVSVGKDRQSTVPTLCIVFGVFVLCVAIVMTILSILNGEEKQCV